MKVALIFFALVALTYSASQQKKLFQEHFEDFNIILGEVGQELDELLRQYLQFEEFHVSLDYLTTSNFKNVLYEMGDLPEFKTVIDYLENHGIDIQYFIDDVNTFADAMQGRRNIHKQLTTLSGRDATGFVLDRMAVFPMAKLTALYEKKIAEDDGFRRAMESFDTEEWDELYSALWQNETFLNEVATLKENGINLEIMLLEYKAILGIY